MKKVKMMNKWTLKINDPAIRKDFEKYAMDNVMSKMPIIIAFQIVFLVSHLTGFATDRFLNLERVLQSIVLTFIASAAYLLTRATGKAVFMKWMPFIYSLANFTVANYIVFNALSEEGEKQGIEQFGDDFPTKLKQLIYSLRDNFTMPFGLAVTLVSADWFTNALSISAMFFVAQNVLSYQINKHEMQG